MNRPLFAIIGIAALVPLIVCLLLTVFAWPVVNTAPNRLPIGLVTTSTMAKRLPQLLEGVRPGGFDLKPYANPEVARRAVLTREIYGAILVDPTKPADFKLLTASAGGPAVAQVLTAVGAQVGTLLEPLGFKAPQIEDVVPATSDDPRQATMIGGVLPLVISGIVSGLLVTSSLRTSTERIVAALLIALVAGFAVTSIMQFGFKTLEGSYLTNSVVVSLSVAANVLFVTGLVASLGTRGLGVASVTLMLISNPFSALSSAPEMLPGVWGAVGQLLPLGAFGHLLRSAAFFNGNGSGQPMFVLLFWAVLGMTLILIGSRQTVQVTAAAPATQATD